METIGGGEAGFGQRRLGGIVCHVKYYLVTTLYRS